MKENGKENVTNTMKYSIVMNVIIVLAILAVSFTGLFGRDLFTPDEPREAAISLEMSKNEDFIIPRLSGVPFIEKPPLYYVFTALSIKLAGPYIGNTNALRLVTALFGVGTLLMTFLLARLFFGQAMGLLSAAILSTMPGFVENFHWIRVDAALCFFVAAGVWCFAEAYIRKRPWFFVPAGLLTAGAFLTKGLIGPVLIAVPWAGLVFVWVKNLKKNGFKQSDLFIGHHVFCLMVFVVTSGIWMVLLRIKGGEALWHEWFWVNHVGRLLGTSISKGHIRTGTHFYYLSQLAVYTLPWFPLLIAWGWAFCRDIKKHETLSAETIFMLIWSIGGLLVLSLSATKRGIYMAPVLPVFALMCAAAVKKTADKKIFKGYFLFWIGFCIVLLAVLAAVPFFKPLFAQKLSAQAVDFLSSFGPGNIMAASGGIVCIYLFLNYKRNQTVVGPVMLATAILYIGLLTVPLKAVDMEKSMRQGIIDFTAKIPAARRPHIAVYSFSETMIGCFYFYSDWPVRQIDDVSRIRSIISGEDTVFDSIIINRDSPKEKAIDYINELLKSPYRMLEEKYTGGRRGLFWVEGNNQLRITN